jgi:CrcB protein
MDVVLIALGGAIGAVLRFFSFEFFTKFLRASNFAHFPVATLFVNVLGSMLAGVLYYFVIRNFSEFDVRLRHFLMTGILGGFTTFSAFSLDFFRLFNAGQISSALIYALSSVFLSILAIFFGFYLMKVIF